jgi:hypothetical protein
VEGGSVKYFITFNHIKKCLIRSNKRRVYVQRTLFIQRIKLTVKENYRLFDVMALFYFYV